MFLYKIMHGLTMVGRVRGFRDRVKGGPGDGGIEWLMGRMKRRGHGLIENDW